MKRNLFYAIVVLSFLFNLTGVAAINKESLKDQKSHDHFIEDKGQIINQN